MVADIFDISVSALRAFQAAIAVTSNNVANASTPGYSKESVVLTSATPQTNGAASIGSGVTTGGGISTALQNFYSAWSAVANTPASAATRQALIGKAQSIASSFSS